MAPRLRLPWRFWVWTAAVLALVAVAALLWRGSDAAATESTTAAPADVPGGTPAGVVSAVWSAPAAARGPDPRSRVADGRVVVAGERGIRALDPASGAEAWHYTRSNARLCDSTVAGSLVVAVFRTEDRCDQAVALTAATGVRAWTRNLDLRPDATLQSAAGTVLATSRTGVLAVDPNGNTLRWRQAAAEGCELTGSAVGEAGVVVLQRCPAASAQHLRLFDATEGSARWTRDVPVAATLVGVGRSVVVADDAGVHVHSGADGALLGTVPRPSPEAPVALSARGDTALLRVGGTVSGLDQATGSVRWSVPGIGLPAPETLVARAPVPVPEVAAFVLRDPATGAEVGRSQAPPLREGALTAAVGPALVSALPDRVLVHR